VRRKEDKTIRAKAPMRFDFAGGYTDVSPYSDIEGGNVVNMALKKFAFVDIRARRDEEVNLYSRDMNVGESFNLNDDVSLEGPMRLLKASIAYLLPDSGIDLTTFVDAPVGSGLGASASLAVALLGSLRILRKETIDPRNLAKDALYVENVLLDNINGGQDQYAAALGGINFFSFDSSDVVVESLSVSHKVIEIIQRRSLLVHSGQTRISGDVLDEVMSGYSNGNNVTVDGLRTLKLASLKLRSILISGDIDDFGEQLLSVYDAQKSLHEKIETPIIKKIFRIAQKLGLEGGKIAGAGGGGCVYLYSNQQSIGRINKKLTAEGFQTSPFLISPHGFQYKID